METVLISERESVRQYLASTDLLRGLTEETLSSIEAELDWMYLKAGDVLVREGETGDCMFILMSGRLRVFITGETGDEQVVAEISPGEAVGEMSLIADERRSATVRAVRASTLVRLTRGVFERIDDEHPELMKHMAQLLVRRLRRLNAPGKRRDAPLTIGIVAATRDFPLENVVERFVQVLAEIGPTSYVTAEIVESQLGKGFSDVEEDDPRDIQLTQWLAQQERCHRFVVYEANSPRSLWSRRVVRQADRILIMAPGEETPQASEVREVLEYSGVLGSAAHKDLVLVHARTDRTASGTQLWQNAARADDRFHLWLYSSQDFERLARVVSGTATGLVLGGGGARGFAHIGVVRALKEAGIPIDFVGGTSIGALIAAEVALDWTPEQMLETTREVFKNHPLHGDYNLPVVSAMTPHKAVKLFEHLFGEHRIEDQWRNFFSVACNLTRGEIVIHRSGRFHDAAEASSALPVLNAPVVENGELIVDGALINNLPADVMKSICGGRVIAVDVSPRRHVHAATGERDLKSSPRIVRAGPRGTATNGLTSVHSIVMRTVMLNSVMASDSVLRYIDLHLKPPVELIEMFDWAAIDDAFSVGYQYATRVLAENPFT